MTQNNEISIAWRSIQLDVTIPEEHAWDFMKEFGEKFAEEVFSQGKEYKPIDSYQKRYDIWDVKVTVWDEYEQKFYDFLKDFCEKRKITYSPLKKPDWLNVG